MSLEMSKICRFITEKKHKKTRIIRWKNAKSYVDIYIYTHTHTHTHTHKKTHFSKHFHEKKCKKIGTDYKKCQCRSKRLSNVEHMSMSMVPPNVDPIWSTSVYTLTPCPTWTSQMTTPSVALQKLSRHTCTNFKPEAWSPMASSPTAISGKKHQAQRQILRISTCIWLGYLCTQILKMDNPHSLPVISNSVGGWHGQDNSGHQNAGTSGHMFVDDREWKEMYYEVRSWLHCVLAALPTSGPAVFKSNNGQSIKSIKSSNGQSRSHIYILWYRSENVQIGISGHFYWDPTFWRSVFRTQLRN